MAVLECCEASAPLIIGDTIAVLTIEAGSPDTIEGLTIYIEPCGDGSSGNCSYQDDYEDLYCDLTNGGTTPNAMVTSTEFVVNGLPANHTLVIDAINRTVRVTDGTSSTIVGGLDVLGFAKPFAWPTASKGGCMRICFDGQGATVNADTTVKAEVADREL